MLHSLFYWSSVHDFVRTIRFRARLASPSPLEFLHDEPFIIDVRFHEVLPYEIEGAAMIPQDAYVALTRRDSAASRLYLVGTGDLKYGPSEFIAEVAAHTVPNAFQAGVVAPVIRFLIRQVAAYRDWDNSPSVGVRAVSFFPAVDPPAGCSTLEVHPMQAFTLSDGLPPWHAGPVQWRILASNHCSETSTFGLPVTGQRTGLCIVAAGPVQEVQRVISRFGDLLGMLTRTQLQPTVTKSDLYAELPPLPRCEANPNRSGVVFSQVAPIVRSAGPLWADWFVGVESVGEKLADESLDAIFRAMSLVTSSWSARTPEERFTQLFLALEACAAWHRTKTRTESWLSSKSHQRRVKRAIKDAVTDVVSELRAAGDHVADMPDGKEAEVLRTTLRATVEDLAKDTGVGIDDVLNEQFKYRNKMFHEGTLDSLSLAPGEFEIAVAQLSCLVERLILGVLGLPWEMTTAKQPFVLDGYASAGSTKSAVLAGWDFPTET